MTDKELDEHTLRGQNLNWDYYGNPIVGGAMARGKGKCGGVRKFDGSGRGVGQKIKQKPKSKKK